MGVYLIVALISLFPLCVLLIFCSVTAASCTEIVLWSGCLAQLKSLWRHRALRKWDVTAKPMLCLYCVKGDSHTFLIDNHVGLHSSQNASYTGTVCGLHLRLTAKPHVHICVICGIFHTEVNTHLPLCSTHNLLIKRQKGLNLCIQVEYFSPCDRSDNISICGIEAPSTYWLSVKSQGRYVMKRSY